MKKAQKELKDILASEGIFGVSTHRGVEVPILNIELKTNNAIKLRDIQERLRKVAEKVASTLEINVTTIR